VPRDILRDHLAINLRLGSASITGPSPHPGRMIRPPLLPVCNQLD
jgi:hypothetical protein